ALADEPPRAPDAARARARVAAPRRRPGGRAVTARAGAGRARAGRRHARRGRTAARVVAARPRPRLDGHAPDARRGRPVTRVALPLADAPSLGALARRTAIVRLVLLALIAVVALAAALTTKKMRVGESAFFAPGSAGEIVLDLSSSTEAAPPEEIELALQRVARSGRRAG